MTRRRRILLIAVTPLLATLAGAALIHFRVHRHDSRIASTEQIDTGGWETPRVAIVFGAGVHGDGRPSPMLEDRLRAAAELYAAHKVDRILVSGDNRFVNYNEPKAMREYLISHAVAPRDVILDYAGRSTYETCLRAREIFGVRRAVLVTQRFHLSRALYLAGELGITAWGVAADRQDYGSELDYQKIREIGAEIKAFFNVHGFPPDALLGDKIPIE
ncbi:MAG TPA: ElyC/SanA/YdcF family protein [Blastocatellia bacterium]|nr:ElyC/SanA/YdcF family protein [Blastocatellia bacterium]